MKPVLSADQGEKDQEQRESHQCLPKRAGRCRDLQYVDLMGRPDQFHRIHHTAERAPLPAVRHPRHAAGTRLCQRRGGEGEVCRQVTAPHHRLSTEIPELCVPDQFRRRAHAGGEQDSLMELERGSAGGRPGPRLHLSKMQEGIVELLIQNGPQCEDTDQTSCGQNGKRPEGDAKRQGEAERTHPIHLPAAAHSQRP